MNELAPQTPEPTLATALRVFAANHFPSRFYFFLQLGIPASIQFLAWGWRRSAVSMLALSAFGIWALCEQALVPEAEEGEDIALPTWRTRVLRIGRGVAGMVAGLSAIGLLFEGFVRLMAFIARCPGCAG